MRGSPGGGLAPITRQRGKSNAVRHPAWSAWPSLLFRAGSEKSWSWLRREAEDRASSRAQAMWRAREARAARRARAEGAAAAAAATLGAAPTWAGKQLRVASGRAYAKQQLEAVALRSRLKRPSRHLARIRNRPHSSRVEKPWRRGSEPRF